MLTCDTEDRVSLLEKELLCLLSQVRGGGEDEGPDADIQT